MGLVPGEEQGSPSLSVRRGGCSGEPRMTGRMCGGHSSEGPSVLFQTSTVQGCEMKVQRGENGDGGNQIFASVGVEGTLPTGLLCL